MQDELRFQVSGQTEEALSYDVRNHQQLQLRCDNFWRRGVCALISNKQDCLPTGTRLGKTPNAIERGGRSRCLSTRLLPHSFCRWLCIPVCLRRSSKCFLWLLYRYVVSSWDGQCSVRRRVVRLQIDFSAGPRGFVVNDLERSLASRVSLRDAHEIRQKGSEVQPGMVIQN